MVKLFEAKTEEQATILDDIARTYKILAELDFANGDKFFERILGITANQELLKKGNSLLQYALDEENDKLASIYIPDLTRLLITAFEAGIPTAEVIAIALHFFHPWDLPGAIFLLAKDHCINANEVTYIEARLSLRANT